VVFRNSAPWIGIEIKEKWKLSASSAEEDIKRLLQCKEAVGLKHGYLVYLGRRWKGPKRKLLPGPKNDRARFLDDITIVLEDRLDQDELRKWEKDFKKKAKYVVEH